jgi:hypothetical protein
MAMTEPKEPQKAPVKAISATSREGAPAWLVPATWRPPRSLSRRKS